MQAAANAPNLAAKMLRENIARNGVAGSAFGVVRKINEKDNELAVKLLDEIAGRLSGETLDANNDRGNMIVNFLRSFYTNPPKASAGPTVPKTFKLEGKTAKDLANKLADFFMKADTTRSINVYYQSRAAFSVLDKIIPERMPVLKQKQEALKKTLPQDLRLGDNDAGSGDNTSERMIARAGCPNRRAGLCTAARSMKP